MIEVPEEFEDYKKVLEMGANKHGANNWLEPNGAKSSFKQMHDSMFHHLARSFADSYYWYNLETKQCHSYEGGLTRIDEESDLDHLLHLICRAQMMYTRIKRNIRHEDDK